MDQMDLMDQMDQMDRPPRPSGTPPKTGGELKLNIEHQTSNVKCQTSNVKRLTSTYIFTIIKNARTKTATVSVIPRTIRLFAKPFPVSAKASQAAAAPLP